MYCFLCRYMSSKSVINPAVHIQDPAIRDAQQEFPAHSVSQPRTSSGGVLPHHAKHHTGQDQLAEPRREPTQNRHSPLEIQNNVSPRPRAHNSRKKVEDQRRITPTSIPELPPSRSFLTNCYLTLQAEFQMNPPPTMREVMHCT